MDAAAESSFEDAKSALGKQIYFSILNLKIIVLSLDV
jgi:hypothetical protein